MSDFNLDLEFTAVNADMVLNLMGQVHDATVKVVESDEERVKSAAKVARATASLSDQLDRAILGYAGSKSAMLEYSAAQLGQTEVLQGQIAMCRGARRLPDADPVASAAGHRPASHHARTLHEVSAGRRVRTTVANERLRAEDANAPSHG